MRRALYTVVLTAAVGALLPAAAGAAPLPASVKVAKCSVERHEAAFYGRMRQIPGSARMALRFTLLEHTGGRSRRVKAPGLGRWRSSKPGVRAFGYRQGFRNLPENASHRVRVEFRWYAQDGSELARAKRRSRRCRQFVALPNLVAQLRGVRVATPGVARYRALVTNTGKAGAKAVQVRLVVDGTIVDTRIIAAIEPGEQRSLAIRGPECMSGARLEADPDRVISESSDTDNSHELSCDALRSLG
jgi:CARDB